MTKRGAAVTLACAMALATWRGYGSTVAYASALALVFWYGGGRGGDGSGEGVVMVIGPATPVAPPLLRRPVGSILHLLFSQP
jgi:hypothetical protein